MSVVAWIVNYQLMLRTAPRYGMLRLRFDPAQHDTEKQGMSC